MKHFTIIMILTTQTLACKGLNQRSDEGTSLLDASTVTTERCSAAWLNDRAFIKGPKKAIFVDDNGAPGVQIHPSNHHIVVHPQAYSVGLDQQGACRIEVFAEASNDTPAVMTLESGDDGSFAVHWDGEIVPLYIAPTFQCSKEWLTGKTFREHPNWGHKRLQFSATNGTPTVRAFASQQLVLPPARAYDLTPVAADSCRISVHSSNGADLNLTLKYSFSGRIGIGWGNSFLDLVPQ